MEQHAAVGEDVLSTRVCLGPQHFTFFHKSVPDQVQKFGPVQSSVGEDCMTTVVGIEKNKHLL